MLIDTPQGIVNTNYVATVTPAAKASDPGGGVTLANGNKVPIPHIDTFEKACGTIVPAQPGFAVVTALLPLGDDEDGILYLEEPVIAFRFTVGTLEHDGPMPITVSGEPDARPGVIWTVLQPNGACFGPEGATDNLAAFKANCERAADWARRNRPSAA